jgi:hypothetical protein
MDFERSIPISGDGGKALGLAFTTLANANFRVVRDEGREAEFAGPRLLSSRQNPLNGARRVHVVVRGGKLHLRADLQGVGWLFAVIAGVIVTIGVALAIVMALMDDSDANPLVLVLPLGIWVILLPIMYLWTRRVVVNAYETLLHNMAAAERRT